MNRALILNLFVLLIHLTAYSQKTSISVMWPTSTAVYLGADNNLMCIVEGVSCDSGILFTDNGAITKESCNYYTFKPDKVADSKIIVSKKIGKKIRKIGEFYLPVRNLPDPVAIVGGLYGGSITKGALNVQQGVGASPPPHLSINIKYSVKSYSVTIIKNKQLIFFKSCEGNLFNEEIYNAFKNLQKDDVVLFSSIIVQLPDGQQTLAKPFELKIE
ncbi:GldM family protein [Terrimonas alba]|uniref:GldM family protein n=1 Tax=Terrimonas alba TaxID=3349636 RepID=UPI0035F41AB0